LGTPTAEKCQRFGAGRRAFILEDQAGIEIGCRIRLPEQLFFLAPQAGDFVDDPA